MFENLAVSDIMKLKLMFSNKHYFGNMLNMYLVVGPTLPNDFCAQKRTINRSQYESDKTVKNEN